MPGTSKERRSTIGLGWLVAIASLVLTVNIAAVSTVRSNQHTRPETSSPSPAARNAPSDERRQDDDQVGEEAAHRVCGDCHPFEDAVQQRRTPVEWIYVVEDMLSRGSAATPEDVPLIERYLARHFGVVEINRATAAELSAVLGLSEADARTVIAYRETHGNFVDIDALLKVPGIDRKKVEGKEEALGF